MKYLITIIFCLCLISHFTSAIIYHDKTTNSTATARETDIQNSNSVNIVEDDDDDDTTEYSASANACRQYSKGISANGPNTWNDTNKFPWMAALAYLDRANRIFYSCNGIVISETFVLTSGACVSMNLQVIFVRLGTYAYKRIDVENPIRHPYFDMSTKKNDIALLPLKESIVFSQSIRPACLQLDASDEDPSTTLVESGWVRHRDPYEQMLKANLHAMPLLECNRTILEYNQRRNLTMLKHGVGRSQFCAYDRNNMTERCRIMSGGALQIFPSESSLPKIIGITSFEFTSLGFGDSCSSKYPGIFTRIANYIPWIESIVWPFHRRKATRRRTNANTTNSMDDSSLILAAKNGHEQIVSRLIQNGADVNQMHDGETLLHAVATTGNEVIARLLIHNGADYTIKNKQGKLASDLATETGFSQLARVLQENVAQRACDKYSIVPGVATSTRILGGEEVETDIEFPWMAALGYVDSNLKVEFNCAGTLISDKFILTAAHCIKDSSPPVLARLGQLNLNNENNGRRPENHYIKQITRHPSYSNLKKTNDIAMVELHNRIYLSESIRPACLQTYLTDENSNVNLTVTGWGMTSSSVRTRSDALLKATLRTVPSAKCSTILSNQTQNTNSSPFRNGILQSHYCAADPNNVSDTCQGDSGGPLQIIRKYHHLSTVVGVVSTGPACGSTLPGIYTRVAYFIDWIESHAWPNGEIVDPLINHALEYD